MHIIAGRSFKDLVINRILSGDIYMYISKYFTDSNRLLCIVIISLLSLAVINSILFKDGYGHYITVDLPEPAEPIRFGIIEASLSDIMIGSDGKLQLDAKSESSLSKAEISLLHNSSDKALARVKFLITKSFIGVRGRQLSILFVKYHQYKDAERNYYKEVEGDITLAEEYTQLENRAALQESYLGREIAQKLYGQQNAFARIMLKMRMTENNTNISDEEREKQMHHLQEKINRLMQQSL